MKTLKLIGFLIFIITLNSCTPEAISEIDDTNNDETNAIKEIRADTGDQNKEDESRGNG